MSSMDPTALMNTAPLWIPALTALTARLAATKTGRQIDAELKWRFRWLSDPEAKKAFFEAFTSGMTRYADEHADSDRARAVAHVLTHIAERGGGGLDQTIILEQVFRQETNRAALDNVVRRYAWVLESELLSLDEVTESLNELIDNYLRPAFLATAYFTTRVGFAEIINLLRDIRSQLGETAIDLEGLDRDYRSMLVEKHEYITMQGISPRVQNRTIGVKMHDIFIPVEAIPESLYPRLRSFDASPTDVSPSMMQASILRESNSFLMATSLDSRVTFFQRRSQAPRHRRSKPSNPGYYTAKSSNSLTRRLLLRYLSSSAHGVPSSKDIQEVGSQHSLAT
jgi:hypothetical protein